MAAAFSRFVGLIFWIGLCYLVAWAGASVSPGMGPSDWYDALDKPSWHPPDWIFGPAWTLLYTIMGIAAWVVWNKFGVRSSWPALAVFLLQLFLNGLWSVIFFGMQEPGWAFFEIILLLAAIFVTTILFFQKNRIAGWLMVPYLLWVSYAAALNGAIWTMN